MLSEVISEYYMKIPIQIDKYETVDLDQDKACFIFRVFILVVAGGKI